MLIVLVVFISLVVTVANATSANLTDVIKSKYPNANTVEIIPHVMKHSEAKGLDPAIVMSIIELESGFNPKAVNPKSGASGLMQIMMRYSQNRFRKPTDVFVTQENIRVGTEILRMWIVNTGNLDRALLRYSGGEVGYPKRIKDNANKYRRAINEDWYQQTIKASNSN